MFKLGSCGLGSCCSLDCCPATAQAEAPAEEEDDNPVGDGQAGHVNDARGPDQGGNGGNDGNGGPPNDGAPPPMPVA